MNPLIRRIEGKICGFAAAGIVAIIGAIPTAYAASLAPHVAVYDIKLSQVHVSRSITHANGRIEFELADGCDGWLVKQRTHLSMTNSQGHEIDTGWVFTAWEAKDGLAYTFEVKRLTAAGEFEEVRGKAELEGPQGVGVVNYSEPEVRSETLPAGTLFPAQHNLDLMRAAADEQLLLWREVFDGAGDEGLFGVNAAVLESLPAELESSLDSPLIDGVPSWRVQLAYFPQSIETIAPNYQQAQRLYANGIVDELEFDYSDFTLSASLKSLEELATADCQ